MKTKTDFSETFQRAIMHKRMARDALVTAASSGDEDYLNFVIEEMRAAGDLIEDMVGGITEDG